MGRRPRAATAETPAAETTESTDNGATTVRRRRRRRVIDHAAQTQTLIDSLLAARGGQGATLEELQKVIMWARGVHAEAAETATLRTKVRTARSESAASRILSADLGKSLLDGVLEGKLFVDVDSSGEITFTATAAGA